MTTEALKPAALTTYEDNTATLTDAYDGFLFAGSTESARKLAGVCGYEIVSEKRDTRFAGNPFLASFFSATIVS
jgi:hypothetical protein